MHISSSRAARAVAVLLLVVAFAPLAAAQTPTPQLKWYLAEGATGSFFEEEVLIGNPNAADATVTITYLQPVQPDGVALAPIQHSFTVKATSRYTEKVNLVPGLADAAAVSAVVESTNGQPIVVERSMYWANGTRRGGHNSEAVAAPSTRWFLAEGSTGFFDAFVLITNADANTAAAIKVTFLKQDGTEVAYPPFTLAANSRTNIWVNVQVPELAGKVFSTVVESTNGTPVFVERAMYFGPGWEGGHGSSGVTALNTSWFFGEGYTGGTPSLSFDTFLLLANPGPTKAKATVTFLREGASPIVKDYELLPTSRENVWVDLLPGLEAAQFSMLVTSDQPIAAERAMCWGPAGNWIEGHNTPGVTQSAKVWAFAEGAEDGIDTTGLSYDSYFLLANPSTQTLSVRATFLREDGTGIVKTFDIPKESRFTLATGGRLGTGELAYPELSNQRFAAFFETTNDVPFVTERAMYWGDGWFGGHASTGTPWAGTVATPHAPPLPLVTSVTPASGPSSGGTAVTIKGSNFRTGSTVTFGGAPAINVVVLNSTTITARTPTGQPGTVPVVVTAESTSTSLAGAYSYVQNSPTITGVSPATGPTTGGTKITITGTNLSNVNAVFIGGVAASGVTVVNSTAVQAVTAPHSAGIADIEVRTGDGYVATAPSRFSYLRATAVDNILAFGDSNTEGVMASDCMWVITPTIQSVFCNYASDGGYPSRLKNLLQAEYPQQPIIVTNAGVGGEMTITGVNRLPTVLAEQQDLAVIMEGVNDLNAGVPYGTIAGNLRIMIRSAKSAHRRVFLGTVLPVVTVTIDGLPYTKSDNAAISELNRRLRIIATEEGATLADFHASFLKPGLDTASLFSGDGLHPNSAGYARMADLLRNLLVPAFETVPSP